MGKFPRKVKGFRVSPYFISADEEIFDTENEARNNVDIEEAEMWECVDCGNRHEEMEDAYSCCS